MAAGEGRRMRPLTDRWPKPVLPIDGRPVVVQLLHERRVTMLHEGAPTVRDQWGPALLSWRAWMHAGSTELVVEEASAP